MKLYKEIKKDLYICYKIDLDKLDTTILNKIYKLFDTKITELKTNKKLFEIRTISQNTPWTSNVMKICRKSNFTFIKFI